MPELNDEPRKVKYITRSIVPSPTGVLIINCIPETIIRFDYQRGNSSRGEYLEELLDMVDGGSDYSELDY